MQLGEFDFGSDPARAGFRLQRLEVYNWGTFHQRVWRLDASGDNALLTGDIGSGKSTLVDAITTLLVPAQRITYNKAAGAEAKERSLRSYVLGYYKTERGEAGLSAKAVGLRDHNGYSVILGHFYNEGFDTHVTLAQVFWIADTKGQPERFYVVADRELAIAGDFDDFGSDLKQLRKRLRDTPHVELHDSFPPYGAAFRRRFGLGAANDQAMELFNQTVSMKSVGNLTDFVRTHMLEALPMEERIAALIRHFDDLDRAHAAVLEARRKIEALTPLVANLERHADLEHQQAQRVEAREALKSYFAHHKATLLERRLERLGGELARLANRLEELQERRHREAHQRDQLKQAIAASGGDRLAQLAREIEELGRARDKCRRRADHYRELAAAVGLEVAEDADAFQANATAIEQALNALDDDETALVNRRTELELELRHLKDQHDELDAELDSLRSRRSNLPARILTLRERLCEATGLDADTLPFAGELLQVRDEARDWEGAAERVLHNFALSLLVPEAHYAAVADWVERTQLRGRLVYYRVREPQAAAPSLHPASLVRKLAIRPDSEHYAWLEQELGKRFDYACCDDLTQFRREQRALTRNGQLKTGGERHEKDDRHRLDDRTRYVLGWSNAAKIAALEDEAAALQRRLQASAERVAAVQREQRGLSQRRSDLSRLQGFGDFQELDWRTPAARLETCEAERRGLEASSDRLKLLQAQLRELDEASRATDDALAEAQGEQGSLNTRRDTAAAQHDEARALVESLDAARREACFARLDEWREPALGEHQLSVESCDNREREMRDWLQADIDARQKQLDRLREAIIKAMQHIMTQWPQDTEEVDASLAAGDDYRAMLVALEADDLPRFEARFKQLLNENTIREIAGFQAFLNQQREDIKGRVATINASLHDIDYNPGRYIRLLAEPSPDAEIRDFRQQLRACTENALSGSDDEQYSEAKFLQVKAIIERFRGREGSTELDRRWTLKVTDVRHHFLFSASERWREDDSEHEHYSDAGGKSGGQKEKLAYTVLAASLAYQFGLEWGESHSRSFRFVVIDEAFGRGSDESARYGLELFARLNLQLLIVTPLQKIHIIEPYVASVGFVHNEEGRQSMLRNLSIEEYRQEKAAREHIEVL
ncbi:ATP-binding protein [Halomonas sp. M4R1S46]|uniref:ATP-binding protein n=1 Tax=Halomonas sp. M4R1S46 TaxID=2982692 RepID=UPI0021E4D70C|nr:ATP-binding protein [Halomonas sp. M4R1S46]UYG07570.1 ATP-dependent exonuclease SbcCD, C subunit-like protein [Halomonas sp. M4R1S46]